MNILFFTRRFYPDIGGVETHVLEISKRLVALGHTITVVCEESQSTSSISRKVPVKNIKIFRIPVGNDEKKKKILIWQWLRKNQNLIKEADIVHCHDVFYWYLPFRFLYRQKPVYTTFHGYEGYPVSKKAIAVRKLSEKLSWGNICVGDFIKKWYRTKPTFVTYGGVNAIKQLQAKTKKATTKIKIVFVGRLAKDTGVDLYTKTLQILKKKNIDFSFDVYGDGPLRRQAAKYRKVHGFVKNVEEKLEKADIVFSSSYLSMLQALASKKLVFAVYTNLLKEDYLRMSPFGKYVVTGNDPEKLAEKIVFYMKQPVLAQKLTNAGFQWAKKQTWDEVVSLYQQLWEKNK